MSPVTGFPKNDPALSAKMFAEARAVAAFGGRLAFAVSGGRDSAVMVDLMSRLLPDMSAHRFFFWTYYPRVLPYKARYLSVLERRYGIRIETRMDPQRCGGKQADFVRDFLEANGCSLCLFGYHMDDSLQRRGMLKRFADGIDRVRRWAYPLRSMTKRTVRGYAASRDVPLALEYRLGLKHDLHEHRGPAAHFLRRYVGEEDYRAAVEQDPAVEIDYVRTVNDPAFLARLASGEG